MKNLQTDGSSSYVTLDALKNTNSILWQTEIIGTFGYMAPEVILGFNGKSKYTTKADVYSLGIIAQKLFDFDINSWVLS